MYRPGVTFLVSSLCIGGAEKQMVSLANGIDDRTFRLSFIYLKDVDILFPQLNAGRFQKIIGCSARDGFDIDALKRLKRHFEEEQVDALVCADPYCMLYGMLARRLARRSVRVVTIYHSTVLRTRKERLQMKLYKRFMPFCDALVYVCQTQRNYWREHGLKARTELVIYNGVDAEHFEDRFSPLQKSRLRTDLGFSELDYVVGLCATLRPEKAHGDLVEAVRRLRALDIPAKALFIGDGSERTRIESRVHESRLQNHVVFAGVQKDVRPYVAVCDVVALTSHAIETFSVASLEAMSLGKPAVLSDIGGAREQIKIGVNGFVFPPGDIQELTRHLQMLADTALRQRMGRNAAAIVRENFSERGMIEEYQKLLEKLAFRSAPALSTRPRGSGERAA